MKEWPVKRHWANVLVVAEADGYSIWLDDEKARTPSGRELMLPGSRLAEKIATEWDCQEGQVDPISMPLTKRANAVLDWIQGNREQALNALAEFAVNDLICYRASEPPELVKLQCDEWDPLKEWIEITTGTNLQIGYGLMPITQSDEYRAALINQVRSLHDFSLTAVGEMTSLTGSAVIALATLKGILSPAAAWKTACLDQRWQTTRWGVVEEARIATENCRSEFYIASEFGSLSESRVGFSVHDAKVRSAE